MEPATRPTDGSTTSVRVLLFGAAELQAGRATTPFVPERRFQLLALLALRSGQWVPRDQIAALLWPERAHAESRRNLRKVLFTAHALPGAQSVEANEHALRWTVATDLNDFERAVAQREWPSAAALRRGALLDGLDDPANAAWSDWLAAERSRWHLAWHRAAIDAAKQQPSAAQRAQAASALLQIDALDEAALALLIDAELAAGRVGDARRAYQAYAERLAEELGVEPAHHLRDRLAHATTSAAPRMPTAPSQSAAVEDEGFVGRRGELKELCALLERPECRLLTVLGPGGIGKSSLARRALAAMARNGTPFTGGTMWVDLQDLADMAAVAARLAQQLGVEINDSADPIEPIARYLADGGERHLVVLDNAEHLPALPDWMERLLAAAPRLTLLVTSRARGHGAHEWLLPLAGLDVPDEASRDLEAAQSFDALHLFALRAHAAQRDFRLERHLAASIAICEAVAGLPLAIELAASWARLLPPEEIARELAGSFDLLERDPAQRTEPLRPEHRSMRAVLDRSWSLLGPHERDALASLAVFQGGFTRQGAQRVAGVALPLLSSLTDKSLIAADAAGRFGMHPLIAAYAQEKLEDDGVRSERVRARHAEFFALHLAALAPHAIGDQRLLAAGVLAEYANCRAAWQWAVEAERADLVYAMARALWSFFENRGRYVEGIEWLTPALKLPPDLPASARALTRLRNGLSLLHHRSGDQHTALALAASGVEAGEHCGDTEAYVGCILNTAMVLWGGMGRAAEALPHYEHGLRVALARGDAHCITWARGNLGVCLVTLGRRDEAEVLLRQALAGAREEGDLYNVACNLNNLAGLLTDRERWAEARALFEEGVRLADRAGMLSMEQYLGSNLARLLFEIGALIEARQQTEVMLRKHGPTMLRSLAWRSALRLVRLDLAESRLSDALRRLQQLVPELRHRAAVDEAAAVRLFGDWLAAQGQMQRAAQAWRTVLGTRRLDALENERLAAKLAELPDAPADSEPAGDIAGWLDAIEATPTQPADPRR